MVRVNQKMMIYTGNNNNAIRTQFSQLTEQVKSTVQEYQFVGYVDMIKPDERILTDPRLSAGKHSCESTCVNGRSCYVVCLFRVMH